MKLKTYLRPAALLLLPLLSSTSARAATIPPLGTAGTFAVLAGSTVTNTGGTTLIGDLGVSPGTALVGFPPGIVSGTTHTGDAAATTAQADATAAYNDAKGQACDVTLTGQDLGGKTLTPGVYCFATSAQLTGQLILDGQGNPSSVFIFQIGSTLTTASNASVVLINGAQPCSSNIFWQVGSSATLGTSTSFTGNILALVSITLNTGSVTNGGLYAQTGAVTLDTNNVVRNNAVCGTAPVATPINTVAPTSTSTPINTVAPTSTSTPIDTATSTSTPIDTATSTSTPIDTATSTSTPVATPISTVIPTTVAIVTVIPTSTSTSTALPNAAATSIAPPNAASTSTATPNTTAAATNAAISTATPASTGAPLGTGTPLATPTNTGTPTSVATDTLARPATKSATDTVISTGEATTLAVLTSTTLLTETVQGVPQIRYHDVTRTHTKIRTLVHYHDATRVHTKIKTLVRYHDVTRVHTKIRTLVHYRTVERVTTITRVKHLTKIRTVVNHKVVYTPKVRYSTVVHHITKLIVLHKTVVTTIVTYHYYHLPKTGRFAGPVAARLRAIPPVEARLSIARLGISWAPIWARDYRTNPDGSLNYDIVPAYGVTRFASSAALGQPGLTVMSGHDDISGSILRSLGRLRRGDVIQARRGSHTFRYVVSSVQVVTPDNVSALNAPRTRPTLALISCTPYWVDTHRVIVIAQMR